MGASLSRKTRRCPEDVLYVSFSGSAGRRVWLYNARLNTFKPTREATCLIGLVPVPLFGVTPRKKASLLPSSRHFLTTIKWFRLIQPSVPNPASGENSGGTPDLCGKIAVGSVTSGLRLMRLQQHHWSEPKCAKAETTYFRQLPSLARFTNSEVDRKRQTTANAPKKTLPSEKRAQSTYCRQTRSSVVLRGIRLCRLSPTDLFAPCRPQDR